MIFQVTDLKGLQPYQVAPALLLHPMGPLGTGGCLLVRA